MFSGSIVALVTPFKDDHIDEESLRDLVEFHIDSGTQALVAAGTTGESGTLTHQEKSQVIRIVVEAARERIPVIAGTAANATKACIELTAEAMNCGVHAALIMTPAYIKPTQEGLFLHYQAIARSSAIPIILYNVPGLNELIVNNSNGFLIAPNHFELARKIEFLINNRDHSSMSRSAINMVILNYSMEINAVKVRSIYLNCYLTQ